MEFNLCENFLVYAIHKCTPSIFGVLFESIKGVLFADRPLLPLFAAKRVDGLELYQRQHKQYKQEMRSMIPFLLSNVRTTKPGSHFQRLKDFINFGIKNILAIFQIKLDFSFKTLTVSGKHISRAPLCGLLLNSTAYTYHY